MSVNQKPWYKRPLPLVGAILGGLVIAVLAYLVGQTLYFMVLIKMGKMKPLAMTQSEKLRLSVSEALDKRLTDKQIQLMEQGANPTIGNPKAKLHIVEFLDYECQYCKQTEPVIEEYMAKHATDTYFVIRDYPVAELHPFAEASALAANCVFEQSQPKYWPFKDWLFSTQGTDRSLEGFVQEVKALDLDTNKFADCYRSGKPLDRISSSSALGAVLGIEGTPAFFFNGSIIQGALSQDFFDIVADEARKKAEAK